MTTPIINPRKAVVVGCGFVGSATAFALMQSHLFSELVLLDVNFDKADGEAKDIAHGIPFAGAMKVYAGTYDDVADAAVVIVTAGANQKPNETRLDLVHKNVDIFKSIIPEIAKRSRCSGNYGYFLYRRRLGLKGGNKRMTYLVV